MKGWCCTGDDPPQKGLLILKAPAAATHKEPKHWHRGWTQGLDGRQHGATRCWPPKLSRTKLFQDDTKSWRRMATNTKHVNVSAGISSLVSQIASADSELWRSCRAGNQATVKTAICPLLRRNLRNWLGKPTPSSMTSRFVGTIAAPLLLTSCH